MTTEEAIIGYKQFRREEALPFDLRIDKRFTSPDADRNFNARPAMRVGLKLTGIQKLTGIHECNVNYGEN